MRLRGKVAVITGAGSGIERAMALLFAREGAKIVAGEWNEATLAEVVDVVRQAGGKITGLHSNVAVREEAEGLVDAAVNAYGRLDVLCNNAGIVDRNQGVAAVTDEIWQRVLSINLDGPMYTTRRAVPVMLEQGSGSIINTASIAALGGGASGVAYTVSKHGLVGLTKNTAWMYGPRGIRCNAIAAGSVRTGIVSPEEYARWDRAGLERTQVYTGLAPTVLDPEDIANMALFLASDESRNVNGAVIPVDAGWAAA